MNPFLENIKQFLGRLSLGQKAGLAAVLLGGIAILIGVGTWAGRPEYALLFGKLESADANKVVEALKTQSIKFELRDNGTAIYVPREQVYELRLQFAGEGLVSDGVLGYELFDKGTLGMTDFMQKLNLKRALEGELARTISSIRQVELCRVHLVIPERSPFREAQTQPSASVVLQLAGGAQLTQQQIEGITSLVSGAVEGLAPGGVTVLDTRGNMLSNPQAGDPDALVNSTQLKMQRAIEAHLTEKGQSMLDQVLGPTNAIVRVTAMLDFTRSVAERETIDPESATVVSEEQLEEQGGEGAGNANSSVRNYELSRTRERSEKNSGEISYLTVSVIMNYKRPMAPANDAAGDAAAPEPQPYTPDEIAQIEEIVKNAVGFNPDRGDRFAIHQTRFDTSVDDQLATDMRLQRRQEQMHLYLRYGLMLLAMALAIWLIRSASKRTRSLTEGASPVLLDQPLQARSLEGGAEGGGQVGAGEGGRKQLEEGDEEELILVDDVYTSKLSPEAQKRLKAKHLMFEEIRQQVLAKPEETADLMRSWMMSDARSANNNRQAA